MHLDSLYCGVCFEVSTVSLESLLNISQVWMTCSTNQKCGNVVDQAASDVHKVAMAQKKVDCTKASSPSVVLSCAV